LGDGGAVPRDEVLQVAVDVSVAIERSGQSGPLELMRVEVEVGFDQPARHLAGDEPIADPSAREDEEHAAALSAA
jgi:hypothetical protein